MRVRMAGAAAALAVVLGGIPSSAATAKTRTVTLAVLPR
jgi:hypothetical protein